MFTAVTNYGLNKIFTIAIVRTAPLFFKEGGVNFNYLPRREESEKSKKGVEVWCWGRSS